MDFLLDGYAIASINYRLSPEAVFPAQLEDCKAAIRWLRAHADAFGIDPDRIGVWGASAGGFLAALLGSAGVPVKFYPVEGAGHGAYFGAAVSDFMPIRRSNRW